jgi:alpha-galactosidase
LGDGGQAVGLCNQGEAAVSVTARWSDLGLKGRKSVHDLWRQQNLGKFSDEFKAEVPRRGVVLVRIGKP